MNKLNFPTAKETYLCGYCSGDIEAGEMYAKEGRKLYSNRYHLDCVRAIQEANKAEFDRKMEVIHDLQFNPQLTQIAAYDATHTTRSLSEVFTTTVSPDITRWLDKVTSPDNDEPIHCGVIEVPEIPQFTREWRQPIQQVRNTRMITPHERNIVNILTVVIAIIVVGIAVACAVLVWA